MEFEKPSEVGYTIYSKSRCPFCTKAKVLLEEEPYTIIDCDMYLVDDTTKQQFLLFIENIIGKEYRTFPMIFKDGEFIGGFTETKVYYDKERAFNTI
uniref:Glutaredoxin domain-containing protein n=1 Tax=viral metagenome TaxID=1070528 RepID=A0A6C0DCG9_9ZZZZ